MKKKIFFLLPLLLLFLSCSSDSNNNEEIQKKENLKDITYEVLLFEFTPDTGHNTSRLRYNIKFTNPNNIAVKGTSILTMNYDGQIITQIKKVQPPYIEIAANSSATESYDVETPLDLNFGKTNSVKLVSVQFAIAQ